MDLRHLRYFIGVATERSFTGAARKLNIAQPPLSRQIQQLEDELGLQLFHRDSRPLRLTEAGRLFQEQALQVLTRFDELRGTMRSFAGASREHLAIGFVGSTIYGVLPAMIRRFRAEAPRIEVNLIEMTTLEQIAALKERRIDLGIGRIRFEDSAIQRQVLQHEPLLLALAGSHPLLARRDAISLTALSSETLIVYPRSPRPSYADQVLSLLEDSGVKPPALREERELQTALGLVAADMGVCIVPSSVRNLKRGDIVYRPLAESAATSPIILSARAGDVSAGVKVFRAICHDAFERQSGARPKKVRKSASG